MPYINGKYYMNPFYGAALERARLEAEGSPDEDFTAREPQIELLSAQNRPQERHKTSVSHHGQAEEAKRFNGDATYYDLPGSKTASGQRFDAGKMSAAMTGEKARLGQNVTVTYTHKNEYGKTVSKSISVVVNDRGPFARQPNGRPIHPLRPDPRGVIDLTPSAFEELTGSLKKGRVPVTVTIPHEQ